MRRLLAAALLGAACVGPAATDAELCRDVIHRMCSKPRCAAVDMMLGLNASSDCTATLTTNTGCGDDAFALADRDTFLACRLPLVRTSDHVDAAPDCNDVDDLFRNCPSMASFLKGTSP